MRSLMVKLIAAFLVISLLGMLLAALFINEYVGREFDDYVIAQRRMAFVDNARAYYSANRSWQGVDRWLFSQAGFRRPNDRPPYNANGRPGNGRPGGERQPPNPGHDPQHNQPVAFVLVDAGGRVVVPYGSYQPGQLVSQQERDKGQAIVVDGQVVGSVLTPDRAGFRDVDEELYLQRTSGALGVATVIALIVALIAGALLARLIIRPLRELTAATRNIADGQLDQRVPVRSRDEIGTLATQFNRMSADLARSIQLRHQMTADIAHDLRTPLTVLSGYLESLRDEVLKPTPERFATLYDETQILLRLVEDLHTLSLADAGELALLRRPSNPQQLLEHVAATYQHAAEQQGLELQVEPATLPEVALDPEQMLRVLRNLISNALRYTPAGGRVSLSGRAKDTALQLIVSDSGAGIAAEHLPNIFERFYRGDSSRNQSSGGSGLGLAIAKSIVELHGGTIEVESGLGQGTSFTITLPR